MDRGAITQGNRAVNWREMMLNKSRHLQNIKSASKAIDNSLP